MSAIIIALLVWSTGQVIFLGIFFVVLAIIVLTLVTTTLRTMRIMKENRADEIRWVSEFHDLPSTSRICRHQFTGEFDHRVCERAFDCNGCATHQRLVERMTSEATVPASVQTTAGFSVPLDRMYHRGHTWVKPDTDGTYTIGIDDFAWRLVGMPDRVELPEPGTHLTINGSALNFIKADSSVRILSPIEGEVVETSKGENGWFLRVKPLGQELKTGHLLRGKEVGAWIEHEFSRLQNLLADPSVGITMPDGGMAVKDMAQEYPDKNWERIYSLMLLEP